MIGSSRVTRAGMAVAALVCSMGADALMGDEPALKVRAVAIGTSEAPLTIELFRWSTDAERGPMLAAFAVPSPGATAAPSTPAAAGRAGRGGRGGGRGGAPPQSPAARLSAAIKAAPTVGFIWGTGPTGYSIKYAWRSASSDGQERVVFATDRRLGAHSASWPVTSGEAADAEFTVVEMRINGKGLGEAKTSLTSPVVVDTAAKTLALDGYADAPTLLRVTR